MSKVKLLLADDHPVVRHGFREIIEKDKQFEIINMFLGKGNKCLTQGY